MAHNFLNKFSKKLLDPMVLVGFLVPVALAILIGLVIRANSNPIAAPVAQTTNASGGVTAVTPVNPPSASEIASANQTILAYCDNDLRVNTSCALIPNSTSSAPGFVETGLHMSGSFAAADTGGTSPDGLALAKGSGTSWAVIWVGQNCIPKDVATENAVPSSFNICSS
ncbi:MAG TPA: hypothetical protein VMB52_04485 [Verrucomicrobiae bacterium]|nr:hypothetical protein [Verrucomicrobiae bacterium]